MLRERLGSESKDLLDVLSAFLGFVSALFLMYYLHSLEHGGSEKVSEKASEEASEKDLEAPRVLERMPTQHMARMQGDSRLETAIGGLHKMQEAEGDMDVETRLLKSDLFNLLSAIAWSDELI